MHASLKALENIAAIFAAGLLLSWGFDWIAGALGFRTSLFCWELYPILRLTYAVGCILTWLGIIIWAFTFFKNEKAALLAIGGVMLVTLPRVLPHYLEKSCPAEPIWTSNAEYVQFILSESSPSPVATPTNSVLTARDSSP